MLKTYRHYQGQRRESLIEVQDGTDFGYPAMDQRGTATRQRQCREQARSGDWSGEGKGRTAARSGRDRTGR